MLLQVDAIFGLSISFFYCFFCSGFYAPTDVQYFTYELENKLLAEYQGKDETGITQEVKEICVEYNDKRIEKA